MNFKTYLMRVLTPLHVGAGTGLGYVDLPIYREAHTDFPAIPASTIKGVFRTEEIRKVSKKKGKEAKQVEEQLTKYDPKEQNAKDEDIEHLYKIFGNQKKEGSVVFTDARVLYFPVKSLKDIFAYVTCPYVIRRFSEDTGENTPDIDISDRNMCKVLNGSSVVVKTNNKDNLVVLEEFALKAEEENSELPGVKFLGESRIVIVHDDLFTYFVKTYTEIQTHIKVGIETGTVEEGALWTEEYIPAETIFYFKVSSDYTIDNHKKIQIGGNSSTGKGIVEVLEL